MTENSTLMEFPCHFPIKIIGKKTGNFKTDIISLVLKHFPETSAAKISCKASQQGNYLAITAIVYTHDQFSLDALYQSLTKHPDIKMVL